MASNWRSPSKVYYKCRQRRKIVLSFLMTVFLLASMEIYSHLPEVGNMESDKRDNHNNMERRIRNVLFAFNLSREENVDINFRGNVDYNLDAESRGNVDSNVDTYSKRNVDSNVGTESKRKVYSNVGTESKRKVDSNVDTDSKRKVDSNVGTDSKRNVDFNVGTDSKRNVDSNVDTDSKRNVYSNVDTYSKRNVDSNVDTDSKRNVDSNVDTDSKRNVDLNVDTNSKRNVDSNVNTDSKGNVDSNVNTDSKGNVDSNVNTDSKGNVDSNVNTDSKRNVDSNVNTDSKRNVDSNVDTDSKRNVDSNIDINSEPNVTSHEQRNLVFLKVHKAASSTVHNIVMRFAFSRNLDVMLPRAANILSETGYLIKQSSLHPYPPDFKFDVVCNHIIFNKDTISKYLKNPVETVYIGIVREPFSQFTSAFYFYLNTYKRATLVNIALDSPKHPIRGFLEKPLKYVDAPDYAMSLSFINNRMSADFGFPMWNLEKYKQNTKLIQRFLKMTEETFHLVMVVDMFDESMVLLRRLLGWKVKDIIYVKSNSLEHSTLAQAKQFPWSINMNFTEEDRRLHKLYAPVDYALYNHFREILLQKLQKQSSEFMEEVKEFKIILRDVTDFCIKDDVTVQELTVPSNRWTEEFKVNRRDCMYIQMSEMDLVRRARDMQVSRYSGKA